MVARASMHDGAWSVISHRYRANAAHAKKRGSKSRALPATTESRSVDRRAVDACTHRHAFVATGNHLDLNAGADGDPHVRRRRRAADRDVFLKMAGLERAGRHRNRLKDRKSKRLNTSK